MRIILDTNILLSALLSPHGAPAKLLEAWERKVFTIVTSAVLIAELRDVVSRPYFRTRLRPSAVELLTAGLRDLSFYCQDLPLGPVAPDPQVFVRSVADRWCSRCASEPLVRCVAGGLAGGNRWVWCE